MGISASVVIDDADVRKLLNGLIKNVGQISEKGKRYVGLLSSIVFRDVIEHFEKEEGPGGRWKPWSARYARYMVSVGKGNNLILSDTGRLRQGWQPSRYRVAKDGILWFNPVPYAAQHDQGIFPYPARKFTWLSKQAVQEIETQTARFVEDIEK